MRMIDAVNALVARVPWSDTWAYSEPYGPYNVKWAEEVKRALYCVTPTNAVVAQFKAEGYDLLVSHHPYVVGVPQVVLHTALDCCRGGMNDQWRDALGIKDAKHFDENLGWYGEIEPATLEELVAKATAFTDKPIGYVYSDVEKISSVVVCSGLGGMVEREARRTGADCYVLGEVSSEPCYSTFQAMIEMGHTISEYKPGLKVVRETLEPLGIQVDGVSLEADVFGGEHYYGGQEDSPGRGGL